MNITLPPIYPVTCHTDHVGVGSTFVAIQGFKHDGLTFIPQALERGATTIVVHNDALLSTDLVSLIYKYNAQLMRVGDTRLALATLSAQALNFPAKKLKIIGITGTKGKTTSSFLLEHIMRNAGYKTALLSTVHNAIGEQIFPMKLTTPQPDYLHIFFKACVDAGVEYVIMEVAAQAMSMQRVAGIEFDGIIFTNFDQEHAEFYETIDAYFQAKASILKQRKKDAPVIINGHDDWLKRIAQPDYISFGTDKVQHATFKITNVRDVQQAVSFDFIWKETNDFAYCPALIGQFNLWNVAGVISMARSLGISQESINHGLQTFKKVPGRLESYQLPNGARCFIDYAHNPSSYLAVLSAMRPLTDHLIVVFGCGGDRDQEKRPHMGSIAAQFADFIILTSDNPRSENPEEIICQIKKGIGDAHFSKIYTELDRAMAIKKAYEQSCSGSIIMLLGKGPDEYQIIGNQKFPFSEAAIVRSLQ